MFSSLSKSLPAMLSPYVPKGPKALIASYLSSALATYFEVDQEKIESRLIDDAKIVLRDVRLRPRKYKQGNAVVTTLGAVEEVIFSWRWSCPGDAGLKTNDTSTESPMSSTSQTQTGIIRDTRLNVKGLNVTLLMAFDDAGNNKGTAPSYDAKPTSQVVVPFDEFETLSGGKSEGLLQKHLQQIIDHLTLSLEKFSITLELVTPNVPGLSDKDGCNKSFSIDFGGKSIELVSLGRVATGISPPCTGGAPSPALDQRISFKHLFANVLVKTDAGDELLPLIEPVSYVATVLRLSGRRFLDGFFSGLEVLGQCGDGLKDEIIFHAGTVQVQALRVVGALIADPAAPVGEQDHFEAIESKSTLFTLPISSMSMILSNGTKLSVPHSVFTYRLDGRICSIEGRGESGIWLNHEHFLDLDCSVGGSSWHVDFTRSVIEVGHKSCDKPGQRAALLHIKDHSVKELLGGFELSRKMADVPDVSAEEGGYSKSWTCSVTGCIDIKLEAGNECLELSLYSPSAAISDGNFHLETLKCEGVSVGSCSWGRIAMHCPSFVVQESARLCIIRGKVSMALESDSVAKRFQEFAWHFVAPFTPDQQGSSIEGSHCSGVELPELDISVEEPEMRLRASVVRLQGSQLSCNHVHMTSSNGNASLNNIVANIGRITTVNISCIENAGSGSYCIFKPVLDAAVVFDGALVSVEVPSVGIEVIENTAKRETATDVCAPQASSNKRGSNALALPFPIRLMLGNLSLKMFENRVIDMNDINLCVVSDGRSCSIKSFGNLQLRLDHRASDETAYNCGGTTSSSWVEASFAPASIVISQRNDAFLLEELKCNGACLGPCSFGHVSAKIPAVFITTECKNKSPEMLVCFNEPLDVAVASWEVGLCLQILVGQFQNKNLAPNKNPLFKVFLPKLVFALQSPKVQMIAHNVTYCGSAGTCDLLHCVGSAGASVSLRGLNFVFVPELSVDIFQVEVLFIPGVIELTAPVTDMKIVYADDSLLVTIESMAVAVLREQVDSETKKANTKDGMGLPFPICLQLQEVLVKLVAAQSDSRVKLTGVDLLLEPDFATPRAEPEKLQEPAVKLSLRQIAVIEHGMFEVKKMSAFALVRPACLDEVNCLSLTASSASVTAGYSSVDWSALFDKNDDKCASSVIRTPFANIGSIQINLSYAGVMVSAAETSIDIPPFNGNAFTSLEDIKSHFSQAVLNRAPGLLSNVEVLGTNVLDSTFTNVGRVASVAAGSVAGSAVGSVAGLAVIDSVKGAIASGKNSRGVSTNEGYKFGDVTRGAMRSVCEASKEGAVRRRGESGGGYVPGDFVVGASASIGEYVQKNKLRLGSAGGSGVGVVIGSALAGPVGFVAGSYLGGKAGKAALKDTKEHLSAKEGHSASINTSGRMAKAGMQKHIAPGRQTRAQIDASNATDQDLLGPGTSIPTSMSVPAAKGEVDLLSFGPPLRSDPVPLKVLAAPSLGTNLHVPVNSSLNSQSSTIPRCQEGTTQQAICYAKAPDCADLLGIDASAAESIPGRTTRQVQSKMTGCPTMQEMGKTGTYTAEYDCCKGRQIRDESGSQNRLSHQEGRLGYGITNQQQHALQSRSIQQGTDALHGQTIHGTFSSGTQAHSTQPRRSPGSTRVDQNQGYRFGDVTRGIISRGRQKDGRSKDSSYKFGDFTRGLLG